MQARWMLVAMGLGWARVAGAQAHPPQKPWFGSGEGRRMYDVQTGDLGCPADDTATKRAGLQQYLATVGAAQDPQVRAAFVKFGQDTSAWFESFAGGVPNMGSWAEIEAEYKAGWAALEALPKSPTTEQMLAALPAYLAAGGRYDRISKLRTAIEGNSPCPKKPGEWGKLEWQLKGAKESASGLVNDRIRDARSALDQWHGQRPNLPEVAPTTYWEHAEWVKKQMEYFVLGQKTRAAITEVARYAEFDPGLRQLVDGAKAELDKYEAGSAKLVEELGKVFLPPLPKHAKFQKLVAGVVADEVAEGGKLLGSIVWPGKGVSKESWSEEVIVRREGDRIWYRIVKFAREGFTTYYAWQPIPSKALAPDLPGMPKTQICELWVQNISRYTKGKPERKAWYPSDSWLTAFIPCANTGKASTMKVK